MRVRRRATFISLCLALGLFLVLGPVYQDEAWAYESEEQPLLELINEYRQANDLAPLVPSETLSASAGYHSEDMQAYDYFSHDTEESSYYPEGSAFVERMAQEGYPTTYAYVGENIAWGQPTAEEVFEDWRISSEHDATMLNERYTGAGRGHVGSYWTADFGSES